MVRLLHAPVWSSSCNVAVFTFQYGQIITVTAPIDTTLPWSFTFQYGQIITKIKKKGGLMWIHLHSSMVRLLRLIQPSLTLVTPIYIPVWSDYYGFKKLLLLCVHWFTFQYGQIITPHTTGTAIANNDLHSSMVRLLPLVGKEDILFLKHLHSSMVRLLHWRGSL